MYLSIIHIKCFLIHNFDYKLIRSLRIGVFKKKMTSLKRLKLQNSFQVLVIN